MALLLIVNLTPAAGAEGTGAWPPEAGLDWIVDEDTYGFNASIRLIDSIIVRNGTTLTLENVTFTFAASELDDIGIKVVGNSRLELMNVTFQSGGPGGFYMELGPNSGGFFENVTISGVASADPDLEGVAIHGDDFTISNSTFSDSRYGLITSSELMLQNNTFYNTSVAILSSGGLRLDEVQDNAFEFMGYNNSLARFRHLVEADLDVVDQDGKNLGSVRVVAVDQFQERRLSMLSWNDGKLWGARLVDEEWTPDGQERFPAQYNVTATFLTASRTFSLDLGSTTALHMVLPLLPELVAGPLYAPLPSTLEAIRPGRDNTTSMVWTDVSAPGGDWQELDYDDDAWFAGTLPLGNNSVEGVDTVTSWDGGVAYLRLYFYLPLDSIIHNGTLYWSGMAPIGGDRINFYLNGPDALAAWQGEAAYWSNTKDIPRDSLRPGLNILTVRYQTQETPFLDLELEVLIARPPTDPLISGSPQELMAVVTNNGSRDADAVDVELWVDDELILSLVRFIPANASRIYLLDLPNLTAGAHTFELRLDPGAKLNETERGDNTAWLNLTAYNVAFEVMTPPDDLELFTNDRKAVVVEVINRGEVDDWPRLARVWPWTLWSVELVRPPARLAPDERVNLTLWISPPDSIAADEYLMELEIGSALGPSAPGNSDPFNLTITILQSLDLAFIQPTDPLLFPLGSSTPLSLTLTNPGNMPYTANLTLVGLAQTEADGWEVTLLTREANVAAGATYQVNLEVQLLANGSRLPTTLTVQATALADPQVQDNVTVELTPAGFSTAEPLAPYQRAKTFYLPWSMLDHEGAIERVELHYRELPPDGSWSNWILFYTDLEEGVEPPFTGQEGYSYQFHTIAVFTGGDREQKTSAEASTIMDLTAPRSRLTLLTPVDEHGETVRDLLNLSWRNLDDDVVAYDLEMRVDNGPWVPLEANTTELSGTYPLEPGHTYSVRSRARDLAGWIEGDSTGLNRVSFTVLDRPYLARLATNTSFSLQNGITGWVLLEPMALVNKVQIQYYDGDGEWITFQTVILADPGESPAQNTSFALSLPVEGINFMRAVVEDDTGAAVTPGDWQVTVLGNGVSGLEMALQRRPFWDTLAVAADPDGDSTFGLELAEGQTTMGYTVNQNPALVAFGDGVRGYRPAAGESVRAIYGAYDMRVVRDSQAPMAPVWLDDVQPDNQSRSVNLRLELTEPEAVVAFWFERSSNPAISWTRFTVSDITIIPEDDIVSQLDSNLTPETSIYYRLGVKDRYDRVSYSTILEVNLSVVPDNTDIDTTPSSSSGRLTGRQLLLLTLMAVIVVVGVLIKFFLDGRREREAFPYPPPDHDYRDYSMAGFVVVGESLKDKLTVECRACGTRRNVTPGQAGEEITCHGCGSLSTFVQVEEDIVDKEPGEVYQKPDLGTITVGGFTVEAPYPIELPGQDEAPEEDEETEEATEVEEGEEEEGEQKAEVDLEEEDASAMMDEAPPEVDKEALDDGDASGADEEIEDTAVDDEADEAEAEGVEAEKTEVVKGAVVEGDFESEPEPVADVEEPEGPERPEGPGGTEGPGDKEAIADAAPALCPDCGKELDPISPEELASCDGCGWSE